MGDNGGVLRAVAVGRSGQHALDQAGEAGYLLLHRLHTLQAVIPAGGGATNITKR